MKDVLEQDRRTARDLGDLRVDVMPSEDWVEGHGEAV